MIEPKVNPTSQATLSREDIYREWLGIRCATPSYYGLLGLPERETDTTAIFHAGRRVKRKLRAYQIGAYKKQALELLAEVGQAVSVLTNTEKKRAYDRDLLKQWLAAAEELYAAHCEGAPRDAGVLEAWLTACTARGIPVTRLLPQVVRRLGPHLAEWPPHGEHQIPLPVALWFYRDAVVLGQCLHLGSLEHRVETVKSVQKVLGVTEGLARLVAEEVGRALHLFAKSRFVAQAKRDPQAFLARMGWRVRRFGGHLGRRGAVLAAMARLLGQRKHDLEQVFDRLAQHEEERPLTRKLSQTKRKAVDELRDVGHQAAELLHLQPQVFFTGLAILIGVIALVLAFLVVGGVLMPWSGRSSPPEAPPVQVEGTPAAAPPTSTSSVAVPPVVSTEALPPIDMTDLEKFARKYPVGPRPRRPMEEEEAVTAPPVEAPPETTDAPVKGPSFFALPATKAPPRKPMWSDNKPAVSAPAISASGPSAPVPPALPPPSPPAATVP